MPESPSRVQIVAYGAVLAVVLLLGVRSLTADGPSEPAGGPPIAVTDAPAGAPGTPTADGAPGAPPPTGAVTPAGPGATTRPASGAGAASAAAGEVTIHVAGAVRRPGLYRLPAGSRLDDAVRTAGGAKRRADLSAINLAALAEDGRQVLVPVRGRGAAVASAPADAAGGAAGMGAGAPAEPVNLNTATLEQLDTLDGVGPATAQKILDFRTANGGFRSVEDLDQIPGIGEKRMAALRPLVTV